jgi:hypothetical protein
MVRSTSAHYDLHARVPATDGLGLGDDGLLWAQAMDKTASAGGLFQAAGIYIEPRHFGSDPSREALFSLSSGGATMTKTTKFEYHRLEIGNRPLYRLEDLYGAMTVRFLRVCLSLLVSPRRDRTKC